MDREMIDRHGSSESTGLLDEKAAARKLGVCPRTLFALRKAGKIAHIRIGKRVLYSPKHLERFLDEQTIGG